MLIVMPCLALAFLSSAPTTERSRTKKRGVGRVKAAWIGLAPALPPLLIRLPLSAACSILCYPRHRVILLVPLACDSKTILCKGKQSLRISTLDVC